MATPKTFKFFFFGYFTCVSRSRLKTRCDLFSMKFPRVISGGTSFIWTCFLLWYLLVWLPINTSFVDLFWWDRSSYPLFYFRWWICVIQWYSPWWLLVLYPLVRSEKKLFIMLFTDNGSFAHSIMWFFPYIEAFSMLKILVFFV